MPLQLSSRYIRFGAFEVDQQHCHVRNLRRIDRRSYAAIDDLHLATGGLIRDCRYFSLDNFAVVEADPDAAMRVDPADS